VTYEYGVVIRRQKKGEPIVWQFWVGAGHVHEESSFLAMMNWAGERGFEAFAAGNFDEMGVPEVLLKRAIAAPPPPAAGGEAASPGTAGRELGAGGARKGSSRPARARKKTPSSKG
jgi:hypothetical protein